MATTNQATNQVDRDLATIVGGHFSPDHLGPDAYRQILDRVRANASGYAQAFTRRYITRLDPMRVADLYLPEFIRILAQHAPDTAAQLRTQLTTALAAAVPSESNDQWEQLDEEGEPDEPTRKRRRLQAQLATLRAG